jgi:aldehyde dehydrogenase (NAD(P)+)
VNAYLGPHLIRALAPFVDAGYLRIVYGGADVGEALVQHPSIAEIHVTGSGATHDAIVFGTGDDGALRKSRGEPRIDKPVTSELGNVSPTIVVPGRWSAADLRFQAENIATQKRHNAGFNCIASQVLIVSDVWPQTDALLRELERVMGAAPKRPQYYPGADTRCAAIGSAPGSIAAVDPALDEPAFRIEVFADVLAVVRLPGESAGAFLDAAVAFANDRLAGTLGANIIVDPAMERDLGVIFDRAVASLRYGCVAINAWTGVGFLLPQATWGAFPGHTPQDVGSGIGVVHNALLFSRAQKTVVRAPFAPFPRSFANGEMTILPKPPWFITHRRAAEAGRALVAYEASPSPLKLPPIFAAALRD